MNNTFFPNNNEKLDFVMKIYEQEISTRDKWIKENIDRLNQAINESSASITISYAISIINHAILVFRLIDLEAITARDSEKEKAKERAKILHERNPKLPKPPASLREIRNDFEHFESRLDQWATSTNPNYYIDLNIGEGIYAPEANTKDNFRSLVGSELIFWNNSVNLQEVVDWVSQIDAIISAQQK